MTNSTHSLTCAECGALFESQCRPDRQIALCSQACRNARTSRISKERRRLPFGYIRQCSWCGRIFMTRVWRSRSCSGECQISSTRRRQKAHAAKKYEPARHSPRSCTYCGETFTPRKLGTTMCSDLCRQRNGDERKKQRSQAIQRLCVKCGALVDRKPGKPVCPGCRVHKRDPLKAAEKERLRRFQKYGITEDEYNAMLERQKGACGICRTFDPGVKGWAIDHCHESNMVRGILCGRCNSAIGLLREDPKIIRAAAGYVEDHTQLRLAT